ncbi:ABC transporter permease [Rouxiella silvae]|uniref:ABC transporter permease n=1 Tax=Rouxiella silvae TaxID=1646373 RepID=A0AA40X5W2_9GAMM|nr:ABC transporter permease [Rouxiella silvae]MBF6639245.1 ABC transporter permease [Rouxiella silvae]ORJ23030.1 ABC transporter permease [Rouxiella silvae]
MLEYLARRLSGGFLTLCIIVTVVFFATRLSGNAADYVLPPGMDAASRVAMSQQFGLDHSAGVQFQKYLSGLVQGNFGISFVERRPVTDIFAERLPNTLILFAIALIFSVVVGGALGIVAAMTRGKALASLIMGCAFLGYATPNFVLAILMILLFSLKLHWLPSSGSSSALHFVMPALVLSALMVAEILRFMRNAMLDVLSQDYIRTARAKGIPAWKVVTRHALRNAAIPVITVISLQIAGLVGRCVLVEAIFATKGIGDLIVKAAIARDYPVLQFGVIVMATIVLVMSVLVDLLYALIDPRIKVTQS